MNCSNDELGAQSATAKYPDTLAIYLAKNQSYIVADVDVRGSGNRGARLEQSVYGSLGLKESYDLQQVIK